ncbi:MAG: hypothetical protein IJP71_00575 [Lachnospiraceae bacterium]|nr:hypothetical protein [Lachnospiraceae bacterium]
MGKGTRLLKKLMALFLVVLMSIESFAAIVSDNDGSAFVTKAEFEAMKKDFADQVTNYNESIDRKIDGAIAAYLAGLRISTKYTLNSIINDINGRGYNLNGAAGFPFSNGSLNISCTEQTPEVWAGGTFTYQNLTEDGDWSSGTSHHTGAGRKTYKAKTGAGTAWRYVPLYGANCLESFMNLYEKLTFGIVDSPAKHASNVYALAHTYSGIPLNRNLDLNAETITESGAGNTSGRWRYKTSVSGTTYGGVEPSSGKGFVTLSKSLINTVNNSTKAYFAPIGAISTSTYGYGYSSEVSLGSLLTMTNPFTGSTATDNEKVTFDTKLFWNCKNASCPWGTDHSLPVLNGNAFEHLYWNKQYVNTTRFALTDMNIYSATLAYGEPIKYYFGLPVCKNDDSSGKLTFSLRPVAVGTGTVANRVGICFRTNPFANTNPSSDSANNMKNIKYKKHGDSIWLDCNSAGGIDNLVPGTTYDFMIEDFPGDTTLWIKPYRVQNSSSTSTTVYAYFETVGNIIIEVE